MRSRLPGHAMRYCRYLVCIIAAVLGLIGAAAPLGAVVGAVTFGHLADRWGRKVVFAIDLAFFIIFSLSERDNRRRHKATERQMKEHFQLEHSEQVGREDEAPGQDADHGDRPAVVGGGDLPGHRLDPVVDAVRGDQHFHRAPRRGRGG